jgi:LacI family transcriptional regulator
MRITRKFIAKEAGVSETAVSDVLSGNPKARISHEVRAKIRRIADKHDYLPNSSARSLVTGRTFNIGFIYRASIADFMKDPFTQEVFLGVESEIEKNEYGLLFALLRDNRDWNPSVRRLLCGHSADGIMLMGAVDSKIIDFMQKKSIPFVLIDFSVEKRKSNTVLPENFEGAYDAVKYLISEDCRDICCMNGIYEGYSHPSYVERPAGYSKAMEEHGLRKNILETLPDVQNAEKAVERLLSAGKCPDAFFAAGDHMAIGCFRALKRFDPSLLKKVRIIGFDNISWLENEKPGLSSVDVPKIQMGREAVQLLLRNIENPSMTPQTVRLSTSLVIRET